VSLAILAADGGAAAADILGLPAVRGAEWAALDGAARTAQRRVEGGARPPRGVPRAPDPRPKPGAQAQKSEFAAKVASARVNPRARAHS